MACSRHTSLTLPSPRNPASTISSFCCAVQLRYFLCSLNLISLSVERPILSLTPDGLSAATPLRDRPALQPNYLSTRDRGAGQGEVVVERLFAQPAGDGGGEKSFDGAFALV